MSRGSVQSTDRLADYVTVAERIGAFYERFPQGSLQSEIVVDDGERVLIRATAHRDANDRLPGVGFAEEVRGSSPVNRTSAVENCQTSAWGRALAALGFEVKHGVASREEVEGARAKPKPPADDTPNHIADPPLATAVDQDRYRAIVAAYQAGPRDESQLRLWLATRDVEVASIEVAVTSLSPELADELVTWLRGDA